MPQKKEIKLWVLDKTHSEKEMLDQAAHGDMVLDPQGGERTMGVRFVQALDEQGTPLSSKKLIRKDTTGSGYCSIPIEVTRHQADPVAAYLPHLTIKMNGETFVHEEDWYTIELDAKSHAALLKKQTGGRAVPASRQVTFFVNGPEAGKGFFIYNPESSSEKNTVKAWKPLNAKTPEKYLQQEIAQQTAEGLSKEQEKNRGIYERKFLDFLKKNPKELLILRNIPKNINKYKEEGGSMTNGSLIKIGEGGSEELPKIIVKYTEWVFKEGNQDSTPVAHELTFTPAVLAAEGPLGQVHFWINEEYNLMLDPPTYRF